MWRLLVIDDDQDRTQLIADWFGPLEFEVLRAHSGHDGLSQAKEFRPDIILLDIVMSPMDGHELLLRLKRHPDTAGIPVVIYSRRADEWDGLQELTRTGLQEGADYVVALKLGMPALEVVVKKVLSPSEQDRVIREQGHALKLGDRCVDVWLDGQHRRLTGRESEVLAYLAGHQGQLCAIEEIWAAVYGHVGERGNVYKMIGQVRAKIEPHPENPIFLLSTRSFGYTLIKGK